MPYIGKKPADIIATAVDTTTGTFSGAVSAASVDADGGVTVDNITIDGTEIDLSSGALTVDSAGSITLDCGDGELLFNNASNGNLLKVQGDSSNVNFISMVQDKDIRFKGNDGGSTITALELDMSVGGMATIANGLVLSDGNIVFAAGHGLDFSNASGSASGSSSALLDDYEEGTFTPGYNQSSANNVALGKYTKIGNMVIVNIRLAVQQTGSTTALGKLTGLPFTIHDNCSHLTINTREYQTTGAHYHANLNPSTTESFTFTRYDNTSTFSSGSDFGFGLTFAYAIQGS